MNVHNCTSLLLYVLLWLPVFVHPAHQVDDFDSHIQLLDILRVQDESLSDFTCDSGSLSTTCVVTHNVTLSKNTVFTGTGNVTFIGSTINCSVKQCALTIDFTQGIVLLNRTVIKAASVHIRGNYVAVDSNSLVNVTARSHLPYEPGDPNLIVDPIIGSAGGGSYGGSGGRSVCSEITPAKGDDYFTWHDKMTGTLSPLDDWDNAFGRGGSGGTKGGGRIHIESNTTLLLNGRLVADVHFQNLICNLFVS